MYARTSIWTIALALMTSRAFGQEAPPGAAPAAEPAPAAAAPEEPRTLAVGKSGVFQPGALLQAWFYLQNFDDETASTFRLRRAEIRVKGEIIPKTIGYMIMIDPARALEFQETTIPVDSTDPMAPAASVDVQQPPPRGVISIFQDFAISFLSDYADVSVGQFKIPVSYEGVNSSSKLLFPERSLVSRTYGDRRDIGVKAEKKIDMFYYYAGLFNGQGQNRLDSNNQKDAALRVEVSPIEGLMVGAVGYVGIGERDEPATRDRIEGDLNLELYDALLRAEYIHAWDMNAAGTDRVEGHGLAVAAGYTFEDTIQPVARLNFLDPNVDTDSAPGAASDSVIGYELGANYYIAGNEAKLQLELGLFDFDTGPNVYEGTLAAQVSF